MSKNNKFSYGRPSAKWTSRKGNDCVLLVLLKVKNRRTLKNSVTISRLDPCFAKKIPLVMIIDQQAREETLDKNN